MNSLTASWAREPERAAELTASSRKRLLVILLRLLLVGLAFRLLVVHELGIRTAAGHGMAYARLHTASTLLVLIAALFVPASTDVPLEGVGAAPVPVALGYVAVQIVCALHVAVVRLRGRNRASVRYH